MKTSINLSFFKLAMATVMLALLQVSAIAQDSAVTKSSSNSTVTTTTTTWYAEPWAWALGAAILIIIIIALTRSSSNSGTTDKVTYTKKVSRES